MPPFPITNSRRIRPQQGGGQGDERRLPLFGKITALHDTSMDVLDTNGDTISVKFNGQTQFRKDRQPAKRTDFKVGDIILVRGQEVTDRSWTAEVVAARSMNGQGGPGGRGGPGGGGPGGRGGFAQQGTLGKDYVAGEIKNVDAPKLTVLRSDNVTQTLELNEDTSMRKGRDSITMADIQPGDHVFARGAVENNVFVPKTVVVIGPEQWKRMQEFGNQARGEGGGAPSPAGWPVARGKFRRSRYAGTQCRATSASVSESAVACSNSGTSSDAAIAVTQMELHR